MNTEYTTQSLPLAQIVAPKKWRALDKNLIPELAESIKGIGLLYPIIVHVNEKGNHVLVAGRHRLEAIKLLGHDTISCCVYCYDETSSSVRFLHNSDENLMRKELTESERTTLLKARFKKLAAAIRESADTRTKKQKSDALLHAVKKSARTGEPAPTEVPAQKLSGLAKHIEQVAGVSKATAKRKIRDAKEATGITLPKGDTHYPKDEAATLLDEISEMEGKPKTGTRAQKKAAAITKAATPAKTAAPAKAEAPTTRSTPMAKAMGELHQCAFSAAQSKRIVDDYELFLTNQVRIKGILERLKKAISKS